MYVVARCTFPECSYSYNPCPPDMQTTGSIGAYIHLGFDVDRQCSEGRGGTLCRNCRLGFAFTLTSTNCVSIHECSWWQPYLTFSRLISWSNCATGSIIALVGDTHSLSIDIKNNSFLQNVVGSIHISVSEYIDVFQCIIQMNTFLSNTNTQDVNYY